MLRSSLAAASDVGVLAGRQVALVMRMVLHLVMIVVLAYARGSRGSLPLPEIGVDLVLLVHNMDVVLLLMVIMMMMVVMRCLVVEVPTAHAQMLSVGVCCHARLSVAHETRRRVAKRIILAGPRHRHVERVV